MLKLKIENENRTEKIPFESGRTEVKKLTKTVKH